MGKEARVTKPVDRSRLSWVPRPAAGERCMMWRSMVLMLAAAAVLADADTAIAGAGSSVRYELGPDADFETGCFPPCECPVMIRAPLKGTFVLVPAGFDGLYRHYDIVDVDWRLPNGSDQAHVTGSGHYKAGGEVALQQQLTLDLALDGGTPATYDSGLVPGGGQFPGIDVSVALNGFFCHDSVYRVEAQPSTTGVEDAPGIARLRIGPNPFEAQAEIVFAMAEAGPVFASVHDLTGRRIRTLAAGESHGTGVQRLIWDGTSDDGDRAGGGIYFVKVRAASRELRGVVVRIAPGR